MMAYQAANRSPRPLHGIFAESVRIRPIAPNGAEMTSDGSMMSETSATSMRVTEI